MTSQVTGVQSALRRKRRTEWLTEFRRTICDRTAPRPAPNKD